MGRKRRKIVKKVVKPFPKLFICPICNEMSVAVYREEGSDIARVVCGNCGARAEVRWLPSYMPVDAYSEFYDIVIGTRKPAEQPVEAGEIEGPADAQPEKQGDIHEASEDRQG